MKALCLSAIFASLLSSTHAEDARPACPAFEKIPLTRSDGTGHYFSPVQVEGHDGRFIVDSGAGTLAILSTAFAKSLGTTLTDLKDGTAVGGAVRMQKTDLQNFKVRGYPRLKLRGLQVVDLSGSTILVEGKPVAPDGLIGAGFLTMSKAVFDPKAKTLLVPPDGTKDRDYLNSLSTSDFVVVPLLKGGMAMAFVDVTIKSKTRSFLIDTGAGGNSLLPDFAAELALEKVAEGTSFGGAGDKRVENVITVATGQCLVGGRLELGSTRFLVHPIGATVSLPEGKVFGGILGTRTFAALGASLDFGSYSLLVPKTMVSEK